MESKEYTHITIYRLERDNIILIEFKEALYIDLTIAEEIAFNRIDFTENLHHYVIMDISKIKQVSPEALKFYQKAGGGFRNMLGAAFLANNPVSELLAKIFIKIPKGFETRAFSNRESALRWLDELCQQV